MPGQAGPAPMPGQGAPMPAGGQFQMPWQVEGSGPLAQPPKKKKTGLIIGIVLGVLLIAAAAVLIPVLLHNQKVNQYNQAVTALENKDYASAITQLEALGDYEDCPKLIQYAWIQQDYQQMEGLIADGKYNQAIQILERRISYFGATSNEGRNAAALATELGTLQSALTDYADGNYASALAEYQSLQIYRDQYRPEMKRCEIQQAADEKNYPLLLVELYALQKGDYDKTFLDSPASAEDQAVSDFYYNNTYDDTLFALIQPGDPELEALKDGAVKYYHYEDAVAIYESGDLEGAIAAFQALGGYEDSDQYIADAQAQLDYLANCAETYAQAEAYIATGEYYKAKKLFDSLGDYEDAAARSAACVQTLPENGAFATGNGSGSSLTIEAPSGTRSVYLKIYDETGAAVAKIFLRPGGSATLELTPGTYTMKVAYGTEWYGETDLFGDDGSYSQLLNGSAPEFVIESNYEYTLTLGGVVNGNVGSEDLGGAGGM